MIELGPCLVGSADHIEFISFTIDSNAGHLHVSSGKTTSDCGFDKESLGNLGLSFEAEFELAVFHIRVDLALRLRCGLVGNVGFSGLNFAVSSGLEDFAGNLEILLEVGDKGFTIASLSI